MESSANGTPKARTRCDCGTITLSNRQPPKRAGWRLLVVPVVVVAATLLHVLFIPGSELQDQLGKCWV